MMKDALDELAEYLRKRSGRWIDGPRYFARWLSALEQVRQIAAPVPAPPAGPRVPRVPTKWMIECGGGKVYGPGDAWDVAAAVWRAMYGAAPAAEPVAQQPPSPVRLPNSVCRNGPCVQAGCQWPTCKTVIAQQPEAPQADDGLVTQLRGTWDPRCLEAADRIESDAERIRTLKTDNAMLNSTLNLAFGEQRSMDARIRALEAEVERLSRNLPTVTTATIAWVASDQYKRELAASRKRERQADERIRALEGDLGRYMMLANTNAAELASARERERAAYERAAQACENIGKDIVCPEECAAAIRALATPDSAASPATE